MLLLFAVIQAITEYHITNVHYALYKTSWVERGNIHSALQTPITVSQAYTHYTVIIKVNHSLLGGKFLQLQNHITRISLEQKASAHCRDL